MVDELRRRLRLSEEAQRETADQRDRLLSEIERLRGELTYERERSKYLACLIDLQQPIVNYDEIRH